jgi:hypothetical protein
MTEEEWANATNVFGLIDKLKVLLGESRSGRRKTRLLACAALRHYWQHWWVTSPDVRELGIADIAERHADGLITESALRFAQKLGVCAPVTWVYDLDPWRAAAGAISCAIQVPGSDLDHLSGLRLLRDIFRNPFRPVAFDPDWRTSTAVALAQQMYDTRDFAAMPILADALQDAGCESPDILDHCRDPRGVHVRGCFVVDLILEKT